MARCSNRNIQERLLMCKNPALDKASDIVNSMEKSQEDAKQLQICFSGQTFCYLASIS